MKRLLLVTLLAVSALVSSGGSASAQNAHPHFPPFGCGGYCIGFLSRLHFHGPLYNYGPYSGYYPFEPYGPWTSNLQYNPPPMSCGKHGCGDGNCGNGGWGHYALATLRNVFHRTNECGSRCGGRGLKLGGLFDFHGKSCSTCGGHGLNFGGLIGHKGKACSTCGGATGCTDGCPAATTSVQPAPVSEKPAASAPTTPAAQTK